MQLRSSISGGQVQTTSTLWALTATQVHHPQPLPDVITSSIHNSQQHMVNLSLLARQEHPHPSKKLGSSNSLVKALARILIIYLQVGLSLTKKPTSALWKLIVRHSLRPKQHFLAAVAEVPVLAPAHGDVRAGTVAQLCRVRRPGSVCQVTVQHAIGKFATILVHWHKLICEGAAKGGIVVLRFHVSLHTPAVEGIALESSRVPFEVVLQLDKHMKRWVHRL